MNKKHPDLNLNEIDEIKRKYNERLNVVIKEFEKEVGIINYSGGLHVKGIERIITHGHGQYYTIELGI